MLLTIFDMEWVELQRKTKTVKVPDNAQQRSLCESAVTRTTGGELYANIRRYFNNVNELDTIN